MTVDRNIEHQQNLQSLPLAIVVLVARSNNPADLVPLVPNLLAALNATILALTGSIEFQSTSFNGQSMSRADLPKLYELQVRLQAQVLLEQHAIERAADLDGGIDRQHFGQRIIASGADEQVAGFHPGR